MSDRQYLVMRADGYAGPFTLAHTDSIAEERIRRGEGPFTRKFNGKTVGHPQLRKTTLTAIHRELQRAHIGDVLTVRKRGGDIVFRVRETVPAVRQIDTNGNDKADRCWSAVKGQFPHISFLGAYVCKEIAGSNTLSQHSYGNAVDIGAATMDQLRVIGHWILTQHDQLDVENLIVGDDIYTREGGYKAQHYSGEYHYHVHVDFYPSYSGPCGVRG